jgi:hypothetical protein
MKKHRVLAALLLFAAVRSATFADTLSFLPQKDNTLYLDLNCQFSKHPVLAEVALFIHRPYA